MSAWNEAQKRQQAADNAWTDLEPTLQREMSVPLVQWAVAYIADMYCSDAHMAEDLLYRYVLQAIANGTAQDAAACAQAALKTQALTFDRWYE